MLVFVKNRSGKSLMPCKPGKAKRLLKSGQARVVSVTPFTIQMLYGSSCYKQEVIAGMDTGSKKIGVAVLSNNQIVYKSEITLRGEEVKRKMEKRKMYRRSRRSRKLRYRKPRFLNRRNSTKLGRLPPSVRHKVEAHLREKKFAESLLPVTSWIVETANFDIHKISNPTVNKKNGKSYQEGQQLGYYNVKAFVLSRDKYTCQKCKKNKNNLKLCVHHIIFRTNGGTDTPNNLVTLCSDCHDKLHLHKNSEKESLKLQKSTQRNTKHATEVSIIRSQLLKKFGSFVETFGYITKFNRERLGLEKTHYNDAIAIVSQNRSIKKICNMVLFKNLVSRGDYQQTKGSRSEKKIPTGKLFGLRKFDKIQTKDFVGFVKGKRSTGFFHISDIFGKVINPSYNIKKRTNRICARKTIIAQFLPSLKEGVSL